METKEKEVSISSIKILMGKREVELTVEEAKKLKAALEEIFGKKVEVIEKHHHHDHYRWWNEYYYTPKPYRFGEIWCSSNSTGKAMGMTKGNTAQALCLSIK